MVYRLRVRAGGLRVCGLGVRTSGLSTRGPRAVRIRASELSFWVGMDVGTQDLKGGEDSRTDATGVVSPRAWVEGHVTVEVDTKGEGHGAGATSVQLSVRLFLGAARLGFIDTHTKPVTHVTLKEKIIMHLQYVKLEVLDADESPTTHHTLTHVINEDEAVAVVV